MIVTWNVELVELHLYDNVCYLPELNRERTNEKEMGEAKIYYVLRRNN